MNRLILIVQIIALVTFSRCCYGQDSNNSKSILSRLSAFSENHPGEKAYLQFDKPWYAAGDTIWFKAYLLNDFLMPSAKSGVINVDIANDSGKVVKQYRVPVESGCSWGNISLDEKEGFTTGTYTIRAYTNWMRNFGDDYFFYKRIYVSGATENNLLVNTSFSTSVINGAHVLSANLLFSDINKIPFTATPLQLEVMNGSKRLYRQKLQTGADGTLDINFNIPEKLSSLAIVAENEQKTKKAIIPVNLNRPENADIQFLPEGGNMVAGLPAHIGFKAIGEDGKGVEISGIITDHNQKQVAQFKSLHNGIGCFDLAVDSGETYTAKVTLPGGLTKQYALPAVKNTGLVLKVRNPMERDSITVIVAATTDLVRSGNNYFLIGKARGIICYAAVFHFNRGSSIQKKIAKSLFPTGITYFTVLSSNYQPLNERLVYIDHHDNLNIKLITNNGSYRPRDSVALKIKVTDHDGNPVAGNFSLAVTDDTQVKTDSLNGENLVNRMLLTSDLKGYIEEPGYYLSSKTTEAWQALDNLLLTQGWIGYDWKQVLDPVFTYQPEKDLAVTGHVTNVFNKPIKGTDILLFSNKPSILIDTTTDLNGKFIFNRLPKIDTPVFVLRAVNKRGKSFNVNITVDEIAPPVFAKPAVPAAVPWYVNIDSTLLVYSKNALQVKQQRDFTPGSHVLKEVIIKAKKTISASENLNGSGNADFVFDEKDLEAAGKKTWLQLLQENIKGFREGSFAVFGLGPNALKQTYLNKYVTNFNPDPTSHQWYCINGQPVVIIVDGMSLTQIIATGTFREMTEYLSHSAEDIKGMEVISSSKYASAYLFRYNPIDPIAGKDLLMEAADDPTYPISIVSSDIAFIEITTRSGHGPVIDNTPGMYLYKPLPISWPKQFYKPKYKVTDTINRMDYRATIDWEPNVVTDANGEATIWFYTADKPSTYTLRVEGTDMKGHLGFKQSTIKVEEKEKAK